jgi:hypothetical protein
MMASSSDHIEKIVICFSAEKYVFQMLLENQGRYKKGNLKGGRSGGSVGERKYPLRKFQIVIDAKDPARLVDFWTKALGYVVEPPPNGFSSWMDFYRKIGLQEEELTEGPDCIVDPEGNGPRIWFHIVPEVKTCKNRLHFDLGVSGGFGVPLNLRRERVEAEAARLIKIGATRLETLEQAGPEHYAVAMADPEDNEFDIN